MNQPKSNGNFDDKVKDYKKSAADGITRKKLFSDLVNAFIGTYKRQRKITIKST